MSDAPPVQTVPVYSLAQVLKHTHAGAALVGMSIIDQQLGDALLLKMRPLSRRMRDRLFSGYGPLSSLSAKIDLAFALQLLDSASYDRATTGRQIRNLFAHVDQWLTFDSTEIKALLSKLPAEGADVADSQSLFVWQLSQVEKHMISIVGDSILKPGPVVRPDE